MHTPIVPDPAAPVPSRYAVGTLHYTRPQLAKVFFWLLWGDFCLTLMDGGVVTSVLNEQLKQAGASKTAIGFINGTVMALMSALLVSVISTTSDRHRSRWGRRMPFLFWSAPPLALMLILLGFSPKIGEWLHGSAPTIAAGFAWAARTFLPDTAGLPEVTLVILAVITFFNVIYKLFDLVPQSLYYPLWADVIPAKLMGTFACMFRIVAALGMFVFNRYIFGWATTHAEWIYIFAGILYMSSFMVMALMVKEGEYPPPPPREHRTGTWLDGAIQYLRESYSIAYYWKFYIATAAFIIAIKSLNQFIQFFGTETMNFTNAEYGKLMSWKDILMIVPFVLLGPVVDRLHPLRTGILAGTLVITMTAVCFFAIKTPVSFAVCVTGLYVTIAIYQAATGAIGPRLLPRAQYGQFNSAGAMLWQFGWAAAATLCGRFIDKTEPRFLFIWCLTFFVVGFLMFVWLYFDWKRLGGDENYVAPLPASSSR